MSDLQYQGELHGAEGALVYSAKSQKTDFCLAFDRGVTPEKAARDKYLSEFQAPSGFQVFKNTLRVFREPKAFDAPAPSGSGRAKITGFSAKSQRALRFKSINADTPLISQFCATYHDKWPTDGEEIKQHLNNFLTQIRQQLGKVAYLWILEFQTRKTPHFHIYFDFPATDDMRYRLGKIWNRIVDPDNETHLWWHTDRVEKKGGRDLSALIPWDMGTGTYLTKYLDKQQQKHVPEEFKNVGRFWGSSRGLVTKPQSFLAEEQEAALKTIGYNNHTVLRWLENWHQKRLDLVFEHVCSKMGDKDSEYKKKKTDWEDSGKVGPFYGPPKVPKPFKSHIMTSKKSVNVYGGSEIYKAILRYLIKGPSSNFQQLVKKEREIYADC